MNVPYPGFAQHWGVLLSSVLMVALSGWLYASFRRRDWARGVPVKSLCAEPVGAVVRRLGLWFGIYR